MSWGAAIEWAFSALWYNVPGLCILVAVVILLLLTDMVTTWHTKTSTNKRRGKHLASTSEPEIVSSQRGAGMKASASPASAVTSSKNSKQAILLQDVIMPYYSASEGATTNATTVTSGNMAIHSNTGSLWSRFMAVMSSTNSWRNRTQQ